MKLPTDKAERKKLFVAVAIVAGVLAYVIGTYGVKPMQNRIATMRAEIETLEKDINSAQQIVKSVRSQEAANQKTVDRIVEETFEGSGLIEPILDNYLLAAKDRLMPRASQAGVVIKEGMLQSLNIRNVPRRSRTTVNAFGAYGVKCTLRAGYSKVVELLAALYEDGPYVCVPSFSIQANPSSPEEHTVTVNVEWPTWNDKASKERFRKHYEEKIEKIRQTAPEKADPAGGAS